MWKWSAPGLLAVADALGGQTGSFAPHHSSQARETLPYSRREHRVLHSGLFLGPKCPHLMALTLEKEQQKKPIQGLMGNGGGLQIMDSFSLQNENLMQSLTKGDDFTPPSLYFLSGCCMPLFLHIHVNAEQRKSCLFGRYHHIRTLGISPHPSAFYISFSENALLFWG